METKKCKNCDKWMIKWDTNVILCAFPPMKQMVWACACGHTESCEPILLVTNPDNKFKERWEKANEE